MRLARSVANRIMRDGLKLIDSAPPSAIKLAAASVMRRLAPMGLPLSQQGYHTGFADIVRIFAEAISETPYGEPLHYPTPLVACVGATNFCPFTCSNCFSNSGPHSGRIDHAVDAVFERLSHSRIPFILLSGGEPLANPSIADQLRPLLEAGKIVYVPTNATIKPLLPLLEAYPHTLSPLLAIWGPRARHDKLRGVGSFARVERNLAELNNLGVKGCLLVVLSTQDLDIFDDVLLLVQKREVETVVVTRLIESGRTEGSAGSSDAEFIRAARSYCRAIQSHVTQIYFDVPELRRASPAASAWGLSNLLGIPVSSECSAGNWMMFIDTDGAAYPCFTFGGRQYARTDPNLSLDAQWNKVVDFRNSLGSCAGCVAEMAAKEVVSA